MAELLRGDEIVACVHRVALSRGAPFPVERATLSPELERRRRDADEHRQRVLEELRTLHPDALTPASTEESSKFLNEGRELVLAPRLAPDLVGLRRATVQALVRVGRHDDRFTYGPVMIKNAEIVESATTRRILQGTLSQLSPADANFAEGFGTRTSPAVLRTLLSLAHATKTLEALGHADPLGRVGVVDRQDRLWWFDLASENYPRYNLAAYEFEYEQRRSVLEAHDRWRVVGGPFPTTAYWHRDCLTCPFGTYCEEELEARDDVSLVRFTNLDQQLLLREHGVTTRRQLAQLDPHQARRARSKVLSPEGDYDREDYLGRSIEKLDDLIYRARAHVRGSSLRIVAPEMMGCPTADVEVDVDMESYNDVTYLWGAYVTVRQPVEGVTNGYVAFAEWGELNAISEARVFARFWQWFDELRVRCLEQGRTFASYCFWAQAEDGAMNRAVAAGLDEGPTAADLEAFRRVQPPQWIDLHEQAKRQIQTEGPLGLKQLASATGFHWRDPNPSGEASMLWYEVAVSESEGALASRQRILEYNEDDCRATKALRDWLNGPAQLLAHRDDPL